MSTPGSSPAGEGMYSKLIDDEGAFDGSGHRPEGGHVGKNPPQTPAGGGIKTWRSFFWASSDCNANWQNTILNKLWNHNPGFTLILLKLYHYNATRFRFWASSGSLSFFFIIHYSEGNFIYWLIIIWSIESLKKKTPKSAEKFSLLSHGIKKSCKSSQTSFLLII